MNLMMECNTCDRCGHPKNTFQTIKFADIFTHLHPHEGHGECQCDDGQGPQQQGRHDANANFSSHNAHPVVKVEPSAGVPVIQQHHTQYLSHGSHQHQQQHNAFNSVFHSEMDHHHAQEEDHRQQIIFMNEFDTHQHPNNNYVIPNITTTYVTVRPGQGSHQNGVVMSPINMESNPIQLPVLVQQQQNQQPVGVITKNQKESPPPLPQPAPRVPCTLCKKTFVNEKMATTHLQRVHEKKNRFVCEICGAVFSYRGSLDSHLCSHTTTPTITFDCPTCSQKFKQKTNLTEHMKGHLNLPKKFPCSHCPSGFSKRVNLRTHMKRKHPEAVEDDATSSLTPYVPPPELPLTISSSTSKKSKKDKSQGQGNFKCDECGRSFLFKNNLKAHLRTHSKEKKYTCTECEKSFIYKESLKNHKLLHTNELPYHCDICGKKFRDRSNRRKHVKNVHKYLFLNNNNGESGSTEGINGGDTSSLPGSEKKLKKSKGNNNVNPPRPPPAEVHQVSNVIKKARKRVKKVTPPTQISEINNPPSTATTSVIVSNAGVEPDRKIIMSPGPRSTIVLPEYAAPPPPQHQALGTNVIVKTPVQMQNVIVYPKQSRPDVISSNAPTFHHFSSPELQSSSSPPVQFGMDASTPTVVTNGGGGFQHFTLSRGIITASSAVTNNVHYNYEPQPEPQYQWDHNQPPNVRTTQDISHDNNIVANTNYVDQSSSSSSQLQYGTTSSNIIYSNSAAMQNNNQTQNNSSGSNISDPNADLDLLTQNGSAFFYKDLSQFDFSYL